MERPEDRELYQLTPELQKVRSVLQSTPGAIAFEDDAFLHSPACRGVRFELEFLKPEMAFDFFKVQSTFAIFGSARTLSPDDAAKNLSETLTEYGKVKAAGKNGQDLAKAKGAVEKAERALQESRYYEMARKLAYVVTKESQAQDGTDRTYVVLTGGGHGIMEAGNRGAFEAGGISASLNIKLPFEQEMNPYVTKGLGFQFHYFSIRKIHFLRRTKALAVFPGGFGTMDELFEVVTLVQTGKIPKIPILLYGREFWEKLIDFKVFEERGLISPEDMSIFTYCETAEEGWQAVRDFYGGK